MQQPDVFRSKLPLLLSNLVLCGIVLVAMRTALWLSLVLVVTPLILAMTPIVMAAWRLTVLRASLQVLVGVLAAIALGMARDIMTLLVHGPEVLSAQLWEERSNPLISLLCFVVGLLCVSSCEKKHRWVTVGAVTVLSAFRRFTLALITSEFDMCVELWIRANTHFCVGAFLATYWMHLGGEQRRMHPNQALLGRRIADRAIFVTAVGIPVLSVSLSSGTNIDIVSWRATPAIFLWPIYTVLLSCISPGANDHCCSQGSCISSGATGRCCCNHIALLVSTQQCALIAAAAAVTFSVWRLFHALHPCSILVVLPGGLISAAHILAALVGMLRPAQCWYAHRIALGSTGALQLVRVGAQAAATRLGLLPDPIGVQCEMHPQYPPADVPREAAILFGLECLFFAGIMSPSVRFVIANLAGKVGLPAAQVLHLRDGVMLDDSRCSVEEKTSLDEPVVHTWQGSLLDITSLPSTGLFAGKTLSCLSEQTEKEAEVDYECDRLLTRRAWLRIDQQRRRRRQHRQARLQGQLLWHLLRRGQRYNTCPFSVLSKDELRLVVEAVVDAKLTHLEEFEQHQPLARTCSQQITANWLLHAVDMTPRTMVNAWSAYATPL